MICRHLAFTFSEHPLRAFKKNHPSGVLPSRKLLLSSSTKVLNASVPPGLLLAGQCHPRWAGGLQPGDVECDELPLSSEVILLLLTTHPPAPPHRTSTSVSLRAPPAQMVLREPPQISSSFTLPHLLQDAWLCQCTSQCYNL